MLGGKNRWGPNRAGTKTGGDLTRRGPLVEGTKRGGGQFRGGQKRGDLKLGNRVLHVSLVISYDSGGMYLLSHVEL